MAELRPFNGAFEINGRCMKDEKGSYYLYRQIRGERVQTGIVGCLPMEAFLKKHIKKCIRSQKEKKAAELDQMQKTGVFNDLVSVTGAFGDVLKDSLSLWMTEHPAFLDFVMDDDVRHTIWRVDEEEMAGQLKALLAEVRDVYLLEGAEKAEAAAEAGFSFVPAVIYPQEEVSVYPYNWIVRDLNGLNEKAFIGSLKFNFELMLMPGFPCKPVEKHSFGLYTGGEWYHLRAWEDIYNGKDFYDQLDLTILQKKVFSPILKIKESGADERMRCVEGIGKLKAFAEMADETKGAAFILYPPALSEIFEAAETGKLLPEKIACFLPKPIEGLFTYSVS